MQGKRNSQQNFNIRGPHKNKCEMNLARKYEETGCGSGSIGVVFERKEKIRTGCRVACLKSSLKKCKNIITKSLNNSLEKH